MTSLALLLLLTGFSDPPVATLRLVARDYAFELPSQAPAGLIEIRLINQGTEPHYARIMRIEGNQTLNDGLEWRRAGGPLPEWLRRAVGLGTTSPGDSTILTVRLPPGRYLVLCTYPGPQGRLHADMGMMATLTLVPNEDSTVTAPEATDTVRLADFSLALTRPLAKGHHLIEVENQSPSVHQMLLIRLPRGVTPETEMQWFRGGSSGPRPGIPAGGVLELPPGGKVWLSVNVGEDRYLLLCGITHPDGRRHFDHGMVWY